jgi:hypothetical protein
MNNEHLESGAHGHEGGHGGHGGHGDKRVAMLVTLLAAFLAVTEISGKGAQTEALVANVNSNDLWSYYQARTIRQTIVDTVADTLEDLRVDASPELGARLQKRIEGFRAQSAHHQSNPEKGDGKVELQARAKATEEDRDRALARYHVMELASATYELAIVLCSISVMLEVPMLVWLGAALGTLGLALSLGGWLAPESLSFLP